jgi:hypothetical protein
LFTLPEGRRRRNGVAGGSVTGRVQQRFHRFHLGNALEIIKSFEFG